MLRPSIRGGGPGLESLDPERKLTQPTGQGIGGRISGTSPLIVRKADVYTAPEKGPDRQHHGGRPKGQTHPGENPRDPPILQQQVVHRLLEQIQTFLTLERPPYCRLVKHTIGLGTGRTHGRTLAGIENAELNACYVGRTGHQSAQGVDLLDQMALADTPDGRVAAHLADGLDIVGQQQSTRPEARRGETCFRPRVSATDYNDIIGLCC